MKTHKSHISIKKATSHQKPLFLCKILRGLFPPKETPVQLLKTFVISFTNGISFRFTASQVVALRSFHRH
jgi:hypothetical protein